MPATTVIRVPAALHRTLKDRAEEAQSTIGAVLEQLLAKEPPPASQPPEVPANGAGPASAAGSAPTTCLHARVIAGWCPDCGERA